MSAPKVRVHELSKVLGVPNADVIDALSKQFGVTVKSHSSTIDQEIADKLIASFKSGGKAEAAKAPAKKTAAKSAKTEEAPAKKAVAKKVVPAKEPAAKEAEEKPAPKKAPVTAPAAQTEAPEKPVEKSTAKPAEKPVEKPAAPAAEKAPARPPVPPEVKRPPAAGGSSTPVRPAGAQPTQSQPAVQQRPTVTVVSIPQKPAKQEERGPRRREEPAAAAVELPKVVSIDEPLSVRELAEKLQLRETELIKHLFMKGMMVTVNQTLDIDFAKNVAREFEFEVVETRTVKHEGEYSHLDAGGSKKLDESKYQNLKSRSPIISIMGHVDHGKTTLLDAIRETRHKIVDTEAGGITQSIGAYTVERNGQKIVFLDTPGHEAFTAMRMRGAQSTDIAILVVAADDGVMPQTIEAINHAKAAQIPIIVAVNKIDKPDADPDKVLVQLADYGLSSEKWGGDTLTVEVSALQKLGLDDVLDSILLVSELLELKADPTVAGEGVIIEAQLDKRMGPVATALVQNGVMKVGDNVLIGAVGGRVRALINDHGERVQSAGPATPVEILGLSGVPNAGEQFRVIRNDKEFKQVLNAEKQRERDLRLNINKPMMAGFAGRVETDEEAVKESKFNLLVKADTQGSLEAVVDQLQRMTNEEVKINIVHSATGDISEADVMLASTANALIIGFNSKEDPNAARLAELQGVMVKKYDVIYHITEDVEKWVLGQLAPETQEVETGAAEVRQIFTVGKTGVIAGCMVTSGKVVRNAKAVVTRNGQEIFSGIMSNLKRFKEDAKEVASGYECGISFDKFNDLQEGDTITVYTVKSLERTSF